MLYSGIDLHKRSLVIHMLDADGVTALQAELKNDRGAAFAYFGNPLRTAFIGSKCRYPARANSSGISSRCTPFAVQCASME